MHPVDENHVALKSSKHQGPEQPPKKFMPRALILKKPTHMTCANYIKVEKNCKQRKWHSDAQTMYSNIECHHYQKHRTPTSHLFRQSMHMPSEDKNHQKFYESWLAWRNLQSLSTRPTNGRKPHCHKESGRNSDSSEVWGLVVPRKIKIMVRKLILTKSWPIIPTLVWLKLLILWIIDLNQNLMMSFIWDTLKYNFKNS